MKKITHLLIIIAVIIAGGLVIYRLKNISVTIPPPNPFPINPGSVVPPPTPTPIVEPTPPPQPIIIPPPTPTPPPSANVPPPPPELNSSVTVGDGVNRLKFTYEQNQLILQSINRGDKELKITTKKIWQLTLRRSDGVKSTLDASTLRVPIRLTTKESANKKIYKFAWDKVFIAPEKELRAAVTIEYISATKNFEWFFEVDLPEGYDLVSVRFPEVAAYAINNPENDIFVEPVYAGTAIKDPYHTIPLETKISSPGVYTMQFFALYDKDSQDGIYLATHDPDSNEKEYRVKPNTGNIEWEPTHYPPVPTPRHYQTPYPVVISFLRGDWFAAAQTYRAWAKTSPMFSRGPWALSSSVSSRTKNVQAMYLQGTPNGFNEHQKIADEFREAADFLGTDNIFAYWYQWHEHWFDSKWPDIEPKSTFKSAVASLANRGLTIIPYYLPGTWDINLPTYNATVANASCWDENGEPRITKSIDREGLKKWDFVRLDPTFAFSRNHEKSVVSRFINDFGAGGIYLDFWSGVSTLNCWNKLANHPQNGGNYWNQGKKNLGREIREYAKSLKPNFVMTSEHLEETLIPVLDMMHEDPTFSTFVPPNMLPIPLWSAVYHDAVLASNFAGLPPFADPSPAPLIRAYITLSYMYGNLLSFTNWFADTSPIFNQNLPANHPMRPTLDYVKMLAKSYSVTRPYVLEGKMLHPLPGTFWSSLDYNEELFLKPWSSVWKSNSGKVGILLANPQDGALFIHTYLNFADYGIPSGRSVKIYETINSGDSTLTSEVQDAYSIDRAVPGYSLVLLELEW